MRQTKHPAFRHARGPYGIAVLGAMLAAAGCQYDDNDWKIDQESGATSSRSGSSSTGNRSGANGTAGSGNSSGNGAGGVPASYPEPEIESMEPTSGPYGTLVTVRGKGLGNASLSGFTLAVGNQGEVELTPEDRQSVVSWDDEEITFRYPFPAEGGVVLEGPKGDAVVGEFTPSWHIAQTIEQAPVVTALASVSSEPGRISILFDTMPLTLLEIGPEGTVEHAVTAEGVETSSLRLFLSTTGKVEAVGVSSDADPVIVHLENQLDDLVAVPTAIKLMASEYAVAGGAAGATVWMLRDAGWQRARPSAGVWKLDKGPIADPEPNAPDHASGASSDGSLYLAKSVDAGTGFPFYDDMEAPSMRRLAPTAAMFGGAMSAGGAVDDYITTLELRSSGDGLVVRVCGSDVDPFGLSGTDHYCFDSLHAPSGAKLSHVSVDAKASAHAFTTERAVAAQCSEQVWSIRTDLDEVGETVLFPCPEAIALGVSGERDYLPVVRYGAYTYLLERNPAFEPGPGGGGGRGRSRRRQRCRIGRSRRSALNRDRGAEFPVLEGNFYGMRPRSPA